MTTALENDPQSAVLEIASEAPNGASGKAKTRIPCTFQGMEGKRLVIETSERVPPSTMVSIEYSDALFLGDVMSCTHKNIDFWNLEIRVEQVLAAFKASWPYARASWGKPSPQPLWLMIPSGALN